MIAQLLVGWEASEEAELSQDLGYAAISYAGWAGGTRQGSEQGRREGLLSMVSDAHPAPFAA